MSSEYLHEAAASLAANCQLPVTAQEHPPLLIVTASDVKEAKKILPSTWNSIEIEIHRPKPE